MVSVRRSGICKDTCSANYKCPKAGEHLGKVNTENEALAGRLHRNTVSRKNSETKLKKEQLESLARNREFKKMKKECQLLRVEKYWLYHSRVRE